MKKQLLVVLGILAIAATVALAISRIKKPPTFEIYGEDVLATNASDGVVAAARHDVHKALADWKTDAHGKSYDPSFLEGARSWTTKGKSEKEPSLALVRGKTEFNDAKGNHIVIEVIGGRDMPTLVFFSPIGDQGAMTLLNAFAASLQKQGVKPSHKP